MVLIAAVLFAASHPNPVFARGLPLLAWIAFLPVFWAVRRMSLASSIILGALYGYLAYGLFNYYLSLFHPLAGLTVGLGYLAYMALLFPLLRLAAIIFPRRGYILQFLIWMAYEYLGTLGFLGFPYGISGYTQWNLLPVIQIADITGVWGVSALVVFPSALLAAALYEADINAKLTSVKAFFRREWAPALAWLTLLTASLAYGFFSPIDYSGERSAKVALIQHNTDPWMPYNAPTAAQSREGYRRDLNVLRRLSDEALAAHPDTELVVWPETAFVPRIHWHLTVRDNQAAWELVRELLAYLGEQEVPFLIGNDDGRRDLSNPNRQLNYNAALLFEEGQIAGLYRKVHLVPFTEHFPYQRQFPRFYRFLENSDTHFWDKGTEFTVFESRGLKFASPICFEDTFGYISRNFVRNGAELLVNLSNDAWANSLSAQMQHMSMAVFRSVENRRSTVRSTTSGQTAAIDPNGRILAMAEPFSETWLVSQVPIVSPITVYTRGGDYLGKAFSALAFLMLIFGAIPYIMRYRFSSS